MVKVNISILTLGIIGFIISLIMLLYPMFIWECVDGCCVINYRSGLTVPGYFLLIISCMMIGFGCLLRDAETRGTS